MKGRNLNKMEEKKAIVWSHSRLNKIIENPKEYYLSYKQGISLKEEKNSLFVGSAVHDGLERNTSDLSEFFATHGSFRTQGTITTEQILAESMVDAFLRRKQDFINEVAYDEETGVVATFTQEEHELTLYCDVKSDKFKDPHKFQGIIDLLFLTDQGWILCDYKTSSKTPDWDVYKSQLFDYILLLRENFPEVPLFKIAIINLQKSGIKQKKNENIESFRRRLQEEYEVNTDLINWHIYPSKEFSEEEITDYIENLTGMLDLAQTIESEHMFYLNHSATTGMYGKSQYWDIFYHTPDCHYLYKIRDNIFDEPSNSILEYRDCIPIDMLTVEKGEKVLNKFRTFEQEANTIFANSKSATKGTIFETLEKKYITDPDLLEKYWLTYEKTKESEDGTIYG